MADAAATRSGRRSGRARSSTSERPPAPRATERSGSTTPSPPADHVCPVAFCPVGAALTAANRASPELVEHLLAAARELLLVVRAVVDARAGDVARPERSPELERIEIA
ncbi:MAG: hypothetical protein ACE14W_07760 [Candidatus Velamenicoccus archaeovorus]